MKPVYKKIIFQCSKETLEKLIHMSECKCLDKKGHNGVLAKMMFTAHLQPLSN